MALFSLRKLRGMVMPMLYALRMMSIIHHPTYPQLSGMACGALRDRGEALCTRLHSVPERVKLAVRTAMHG